MKEQPDFRCSISVNATPAVVTASIQNVSGWWATNVRGTNLHLHDRFTVRFGKTFAILETTELLPGRKIVWTVTDCYLPLFKNETQWTGTRLEWDISTDGHATSITMTHVGLRPGVECYDDCKIGWTFYVTESLQKLITENKGFPGTGIFARILNADRKYEGLIYFKNDPIPDYPSGYIFVDVKETSGEQVISAYSAAPFNKATFDSTQVKGDYFMIVENKALYQNIVPLEDILQTVTP
jgi:hypothetical protein